MKCLTFKAHYIMLKNKLKRISKLIKYILIFTQVLYIFQVGNVFADVKVNKFSFTMGEINLPSSIRKTTTTWLPWLDTTKIYEGFPLESIVKELNLPAPKTVTLTGLDGYEVSIDYTLLVKNEANIVDTIDGEDLLEPFGPYWLIMNQSRYPIVGNKLFRKAMVWQLDKIAFHYYP